MTWCLINEDDDNEDEDLPASGDPELAESARDRIELERNRGILEGIYQSSDDDE